MGTNKSQWKLDTNRTPSSSSPSMPIAPELSEPGRAKAESSIVVRPAKRTLSELVLAPIVLDQISSAIHRIKGHKTIYEDWGLGEVSSKGASVAINLFGPPGTGKTTVAEAIANELGQPIIEASYAELESKYVGDTPKNIVAIFKAASNLGAVLFFDEADSILGHRLSSVTQSADHAVNVGRATMLIQLEAFDGVVVFATNLQRNYDKAFVRRIIAHIELSLPTTELRAQLWRRLVPAKMPVEKDFDVNLLADQSEGFSGGDILNAVELAAASSYAESGSAGPITLKSFLSGIAQTKSAKAAVG